MNTKPLSRSPILIIALVINVFFLFPALPQAPIRPIWTKADVIGYKQTVYKRPPFYTGSMPLKYDSGAYRYFDTKLILVSDFDGFSNFFVYTTGATGFAHTGIAAGARAFDNQGRLLAEARLLRILSNNGNFRGVEIEERHYGPDGQIAFKCKSLIDDFGFKREESERFGQKLRDYFFIWPTHEIYG